MSTSFRLPPARKELPRSVVLGVLCAFVLFVVMALAQMIGEVKPPEHQIEETLVAYVPPAVEEIEEEEPPPPEEEEPPPELEEEPPQLSLDQLDIALNPGTGGSLAGDFGLPTIGTSSQDLGTEDFVDFSDLDQLPKPVGVSGFNFPRRLKSKKVSGKIYLLIQLDESGKVISAKVDSSSLPDFDDFVVGEVRRWKFTPPTKGGQPVRAQARLPIPISIQ
jgi:periplasmic protein TonB